MGIQTVFNELLSNPFPLIICIAIIAFVILEISIFLNEYKQYKKSTYFEITKNAYLSVRYNKGRYGEYLIYKNLSFFEANDGKFLFNLYIPKDDNSTTEIDLVLICSKGLFVTESKNYNGWIFGNEAQKSWTQVIYNNKKYFYNPIQQNKLHINALKKIIQEMVPIYSIITFSDRCTLKKITIKSKNVNVINRCSIAPVVAQICNQTNEGLLSEAEINDIYNKLYPYTQVSSEVKFQHIQNARQFL